jgi:sugar phosphate isomerase/epimerase
MLHPMPLPEVIAFASANGFDCIEVCVWPSDEHQWGGVTHIDAEKFDDEMAEDLRKQLGFHQVAISALTYCSNPLHPDQNQAARTIQHLYRLIEVAAALGVPVINAYAGMHYDHSWDENFTRFTKLWASLTERAAELSVAFAINNAPASFCNGPVRGSNMARSPAIWQRMFQLVSVSNLGLAYDPAHLVSLFIDPARPLFDFADRIMHVQAHDLSVDKRKLDRVGSLACVDDYVTQEVVGDGDVDWAEVIAALKAIRYSGAISIENLRRGDHEFVRNSIIRSAHIIRGHLG